MIRQPAGASGTVRSMCLSRHQRKAVSVLPVPVGARMSVDSPRAMAGQPSRWGAGGCWKAARNQAAVMGWKSASAASPVAAGSAPGLGSTRPDSVALPFLRGVVGFDIAPLLSQQWLLDALEGKRNPGPVNGRGGW